LGCGVEAGATTPFQVQLGKVKNLILEAARWICSTKNVRYRHEKIPRKKNQSNKSENIMKS